MSAQCATLRERTAFVLRRGEAQGAGADAFGGIEQAPVATWPWIEAAARVATRLRALEAVQPLYRLAARFRLETPDPSLRMPDIELRW